MKKSFLICLFVLGLTTQIQAQDDAAFKVETIEFLKLTGAGDAFVKAIDQIGVAVPEANKEAYKQEAMGTIDGLYGKMAELYMAEFTQDEIKELVTFYNTDLGKKLAHKQLDLTQKAMAFGQTWGMEVHAISQKHM
ncbi:hypothetical protein PK35_05210 [Tamlana nanhaiensis]|uniref:DUF2059 domain-containing protein n=1 Tax=Neotamlana nanhaiensis TaxID=1382798 RepID=A0A0D7W600_9FLAO|nr:DUF2059 domain-containing protein [Tamlana nanhaiensis]KJD34128.1 hypothetical protein PK35_05210 [Tamlana nanhaiensis]